MYIYASIFCIYSTFYLTGSSIGISYCIKKAPAPGQRQMLFIYAVLLKNVSQELSGWLTKRFPHMPHRPFLDS